MNLNNNNNRNEQAIARPIDLVNVIVANDPSRPDFSISVDILQEPRAQPSYRAAVAANGKPFLYDPSSPRKALLRRIISHAITRDVQIRQSDFPIFRAFSDSEPLMVQLYAKFYVSRNKDVDNMFKFLLDVLQGVVYENDRAIFDLHGTKFLVRPTEARTELYITYCSL